MSQILLYKFQYLEVSLIGVGILLIILFAMKKQAVLKTSYSDILLKILVIVNIIILLSDSLILLLRYCSEIPFLILSNLTCILYFVGQQVFSLTWFLFVISKVKPDFSFSNFKKLFILFPTIISIILIIISPCTGFIFSVSNNNVYSRGSLLPILVFLNYVYYINSIVVIIMNMITNKTMKENSPYLSLILYSVPTLIVNFVQLVLYGVTVTWVFSALSLLLLYLNHQIGKMYCDKLTGLYNRDYINKKIEWLISEYKDNSVLFLAMGDLDHFKKINDNYGHLVGDKALISMAEILKKSCPFKVDVARFAGDEFVFVGVVKEEKDIKDMLKKLDKNIMEFNEMNDAQYNLSISVGYAIYDKEKHDTMDELIFNADKKMYKKKQEKKAK